MRGPVLFLALLLAAAPARADSPLARLADKLAGQIAELARGRAVELAVPEDRTGRGAALSLDLRALLAARIEGRVPLAESGLRLRVASVLSESARRLMLSARVTEEPGGALVDLLSASVESDDTLLALSAVRAPAAGRSVEVVSAWRTPSLEAPALDLAFADDERLLVLFADAIALYRWEAAGLTQQSRQALPGPRAAVRSPGGRIAAAPREAAFWVLTSASPRAVLFALEGNRLVRRLEADALPWPGCDAGLRYRPGTNLLEGTVGALGGGPFLALAGSPTAVAVGPDGRLVDAASSGPGPRVGPALAPLWDSLLAVPSAEPPGPLDSILILAREGGWGLVEALPVEGAVRALAARVHEGAARLVAALEDTDRGATHLLLLELRLRAPSEP